MTATDARTMLITDQTRGELDRTLTPEMAAQAESKGS
jgi:hypothetical protein